MAVSYVVIGAGLEGSAAAYDFARFGNAGEIVLADADAEAARKAADKVNGLTGRQLARHVCIDSADTGKMIALLRNATVCLSAVPYRFNVALSKAAIEAGCHFCDLGGNTEVVFQQHQLHEAASAAGITIAPDCGLAPGMGNILAVYGMRKLENPKRVRIRVGGLPQRPRPPLDYHLFFNIEGLTNEYFGKAVVLRNGQRTEVDTFTELETIDFPEPIGRCEAFMTYGGTSTCPWTFAGVLQEFDEKTVRYPGHYDKMKVIYDLGLLDLEPVIVDGKAVVPRALFHKVAEPRLKSGDDKDVVVLRVSVAGDTEEIVLDLVDYYDESAGFTAMQRTTGFGAAIVAIMMGTGQLSSGCIRLEQEIDPVTYVAEMRKRDFVLSEHHQEPTDG
jgi:lysine 6-dehydrogenase